VFGLLTAIDGICFVLFHVEQSAPWFYRWRMVGDLPEIYRQWQFGVARSTFERIQPPAQNCRVEVEVRASEADAWAAPDPVMLRAPCLCDFRLTAKQDVSLPRERHELIGAVRDHGVARYGFIGEIDLRAGESMVVEAASDSAVLANVLLQAGEFKSWDPRLVVENVEPCSGGFIEDSTPGVLRKPESYRRPQIYAFGDPELAKPEKV